MPRLVHPMACCLVLVLLSASGCGVSPARHADPGPIRSSPAPVPAGRAVGAGDSAPGADASEGAAPAAPPRFGFAPPAGDRAREDRLSVPVWHVGDQWAFRWESSQGQGEYVWTVDRLAVLDREPQYVVKVGPREIYFRTRDLATSLEMVGGVAEKRHLPPRTTFSWPLTPGAIWRQTYTEETGPERRAAERVIAWQVMGEEQLQLGAGLFDTVRIVARHWHHDSPALMYEMWYAPRAKQWVRLKEHYPEGIRYRELTELAIR